MKKLFPSLCLLLLLTTGSAFLNRIPEPPGTQAYTGLRFPYQKAGLSEREAAAHLLNRFSFGPKPGQVDEVVKMGLEKWFEKQLEASYPEDSLEKLLSGYESLHMTNAQIVQTYPKGGQVLRMAIKDGVIDRDSAKTDKQEYRRQVQEYMQKNGYKPEQEMVRQLVNQKILRAAYSDNQLKEVLTDFWFNHFNVSLTKGDDRQFITAYERDAIRPNVLGNFETLLTATAKSPAMLTYLDNFRSVAAEDQTSKQQKKREEETMKQLEKRQASDTMMQQNDFVGKLKKAQQSQGLNENYAREVMELHTLGVDGGYTQTDVTQAARVLTGWSIFPMGGYGGQGAKMLERLGPDRMKRMGFVHEGDFLFIATKHDQGEKTILGVHFPQNGGYEEGLKLFHLLATHPSTAKFISRKLAVRFVSDNPPQSLIDKMAKTFLEKNGNISEVLKTMVSAPEFWSKEALREKTKSPFELAISSVRSLDARIDAPYALYQWITRMGQQVYFYQAPTGFPDRGQYWINTGSLLNRMNFGLALASQRIPGIHFDLAALNDHHEPESAQAALTVYSKILLPERNVDETIRRLQPMLNNPELEKKLDDAAGKTAAPKAATDIEDNDAMMNQDPAVKRGKQQGLKRGGNTNVQFAMGNNSMLGQVVGIIIGSPEFQRK